MAELTWEELEKKHIPNSGMSNTMFGEAVRALSRLEYELWNNGNCNWHHDGTDSYYQRLYHFLHSYIGEYKPTELHHVQAIKSLRGDYDNDDICDERKPHFDAIKEALLGLE